MGATTGSSCSYCGNSNPVAYPDVIQTLSWLEVFCQSADTSYIELPIVLSVSHGTGKRCFYC